MDMYYDKKCECEEGIFFDISHYDTIISDTLKGYKPNGTTLFNFIKNGIKEENKRNYRDICRPLGKSKTKNRGRSAGVCDIKKFPADAVVLCDKDGNEYNDGKERYSVYYKKADGSVVKRCQSNLSRCGVAGSFDKVGKLECRSVGWTQKNPKKQAILNELCEEVDALHRENEPISYKYHKIRANQVDNKYLLGDTIYSTMTINYDFRTASHRDKGDLERGLSTLTIFEDNGSDYEGFYLGLPEYKICFDVRDGDTIIFDAHELHANTEYKVNSQRLPIDDMTGNNFAGRIAVVIYLRERLDRCVN